MKDRKVIVYCRVSSSNQKDDLESQVKSMESYCSSNGIKIDELIKEIGGGMNFKRKKFLQLMDDVAKGEISKILIAHKDRLSRFGFDVLVMFAVLMVVSWKSLIKSLCRQKKK